MPIEILKELFERIDSEIKPIDELAISASIKKVFENRGTKATTDQEIAELFAFDFHPNYHDQGTKGGTYYGPQFVFPNDQGEMAEFPSAQRLNDNILDYWKTRAIETRHPLVALRYADLFVDFYKHGGKTREGFFEMAKRVIDMTIEICKSSLDDDHGCITKLGRAFKVAKLMGLGYRIDDLKKTAIATEQRIAQDDKPGLWGNSFKWLLLENEKINLTKEEEGDLVADMEARLIRLAEAEEPKVWPFECGAHLLAQYYALKGSVSDLQNLLTRLENILRKDKYSNSNGMLVTNYLQKLIDIYSRFPGHEFARQAVGRITGEMGHLGDRGKFEGHTVSAEVTITDKQKMDFIDAVFKGSNLEMVINRIAVHFVPKKDSVQSQLNNISKKHVFRYLVTSKIVSEDGYTLVEFGPIQEDPDQHLINHLSQVIHFASPFLFWSFEELKKRYTPKELYEILAQSPLFKPEEKPYLEKILSSFWIGDFLTASSLMVPLIEDSIRNIFRLNKQPYLRSDSEYRGYMLIALHNLIKAGLVKNVYRDLGESMELYLETLLCSPIGWNLRNNFAHGVNKMSLMNEEVSNRLMHVLFCLSLVKANADEG